MFEGITVGAGTALAIWLVGWKVSIVWNTFKHITE
jgi:hypothetical protein